MGKRLHRGNFMAGGELTEFGRNELRRYASMGLSTGEIQRLVPQSVPRQSIIAHLAVSRRGNNNSQSGDSK